MGITVRTGRGNRSFKAADNEFSNFINQSILQEVIKKSEKDRVALVRRLTDKIEKDVNQSLSQALPFAAKTLMGLTSPFSGSTTISTDFMLNRTNSRDVLATSDPKKPLKIPSHSGQIIWPALTARTIMKKSGRGYGLKASSTRRNNAYKFFIDTGKLRRSVTGKARALLSVLGRTQVIYKEKVESFVVGPINRKTHVGSITIKIAPLATTGLIPGFTSGNWADSNSNVPLEKRLGFDLFELEQLSGAQTSSGHIVHRPLLQPVVAFWLLFKIPAVIRSTIKKSAGRLNVVRKSS